MDLLPPTTTFEEPWERNGDGSSAPNSLVEMAAQHRHLDAMNLLIQAKVFRDRAAREGTSLMDGGDDGVQGGGGGGVEVS